MILESNVNMGVTVRSHRGYTVRIHAGQSRLYTSYDQVATGVTLDGEYTVRIHYSAPSLQVSPVDGTAIYLCSVLVELIRHSPIMTFSTEDAYQTRFMRPAPASDAVRVIQKKISLHVKRTLDVMGAKAAEAMDLRGNSPASLVMDLYAAIDEAIQRYPIFDGTEFDALSSMISHDVDTHLENVMKPKQYLEGQGDW